MSYRIRHPLFSIAEGWSAQIAFQKMFLGGDMKIAGLALKALPV